MRVPRRKAKSPQAKVTDHDHGYQRLFSHPEMIRDLLIGFVREPWIADLDFATLERHPAQPGRPERMAGRPGTAGTAPLPAALAVRGVSASAAAAGIIPRTQRFGGGAHHVDRTGHRLGLTG